VINGKADEGLLAEVFSNDGIGTLVHANEYQQIRAGQERKDCQRDSIADQAGRRGPTKLVRREPDRSREKISATISCSSSMRIRSPVSRYHIYPDQQKGELACLYVSSSHENQGIGRKLIQFVESRRARELGVA